MELNIEHVTKTFDSVTALEDISVQIRSSEFVAILGPSGCGKTTLLRILAGFMPTTKGAVSFGEELYSSENFSIPVEKRNLGMVFQSFALWPHMTVKEHLYFPLNSDRSSQLTADEKEKLMKKTLKMVGLTEMGDRLPGELSGGQKQRVSLARAIVAEPGVLLMDEPLSALDAELKINMRKEIQDIHALTGSTIVYVTHDQEEALAMADRIIVMKDGKIEQIGTPEEIYLHPKTAFVASFVSKCNLIPGKWRGDRFFVGDTGIVYEREGVAEYFLKQQLYPVRPEQFQIVARGDGISGTVTNRQFIGRELKYQIQTAYGTIEVCQEAIQKFEIGKQVGIVKK